MLILHASSLPDVVGGRLPIIVLGIGARIIQHWYFPLAVLLLLFWHLRSRRITARSLAETPFWLPAVIVVGQVAADVMAIGFNPLEVHDELAQAAGRLLTQLSPIVWLTTIGLYSTLGTFEADKTHEPVGSRRARRQVTLVAPPVRLQPRTADPDRRGNLVRPVNWSSTLLQQDPPPSSWRMGP
jgi:hypothetical protein